jgi:hypothetical protein
VADIADFSQDVARAKPLSPGDIIGQLHQQCSDALNASVAGPNVAAVGRSYLFVDDLDAWHEALGGRPSARLVATGCSEYVLSLLNACQGQYRNAFKGLRLVLELCLQSVHLSADLLAEQEWLRGERHTNWSALVSSDAGPLSTRYAQAFFPELATHAAHFRILAETLYTELSECIHGNVPTLIPLPDRLQFQQETFDLWHSKAAVVRLVVQFAFALRYLKEIAPEGRQRVEPSLLEQLGHIDAVRAKFLA